MDEKYFNTLESKLATALRPIKPSRKFIEQVGARVRIAPPEVIINRAHNPAFWIWVIGGALSGMLLLITGVRALFYFFGRGK